MENHYYNLKKPSLWHAQIHFGVAVFVMLSLSGGVLWLLQSESENVSQQKPVEYSGVLINRTQASDVVETELVEESEIKWSFLPGPISMDLIKSNGCVADGLLSGYGDKTKEIVKMINRSKCVYLHRALETWLEPPDFDEALKIMQQIDKKPLVYGMFLAEAVAINRTYDDEATNGRLFFKKMCRTGTEGRWGDNTCIPSIQNVEYRRYLKAVTHRAIDMGIQSFLFGQMQLQDEQPSYAETEMKKIIADMRQYARDKNVEIIIGAQTDDIMDEKYLRMFDYIEGGVGIDSQGKVEDQPCFSGHASCWALLWDKRYSSKANNVLLHLDWSGLTWDDMGVFARMSQDRRIATLDSLYKKFTLRKMGFMMPFLATLNQANDGCYGPNKNFYTPSNKYKCKDEDAINGLMPDVAL